VTVILMKYVIYWKSYV